MLVVKRKTFGKGSLFTVNDRCVIRRECRMKTRKVYIDPSELQNRQGAETETHRLLPPSITGSIISPSGSYDALITGSGLDFQVLLSNI